MSFLFKIRNLSLSLIKSNCLTQSSGFLKKENLITRSKTRRSYSTNEDKQSINYLNKRIVDNKSQNILVYTCNSEGSIRVNVLGVVGGLILLGASYNSWHLFGSVKFKSRNVEQEAGFFAVILKIIGSEYFKLSLCLTTALIGVSIMFVTMFFTARSVNKMYLLKGGNSIGIITDGIFGKQMKYVLDLGDTAFSSTRKLRTSQVTFKNKKHFFYFLMNNIEGEYHEKQLFDHIICTKR